MRGGGALGAEKKTEIQSNSFAFRCAIASYLVEVIHCECFAGLKDSSHPPAGKRCPGDVVSATACTPV